MAKRNIIPRADIYKRRAMIAQLMSNNVLYPIQIKGQLTEVFPDIDTKTIENDIRFIMKQEAYQWIDDLAKWGYAYQCKRVTNKLVEAQIEIEKQMKTALQKNDINLWKSLVAELRKNLAEQTSTLGNGPTLSKLREIVG